MEVSAKPLTVEGKAFSFQRAWPLALILFAAFLVYASTLHNELVYDDVFIISENNATIKNPWDFKAIFGGVYQLGKTAIGINYRPLVVWSFALNYRVNTLLGLPGTAPFGFHFTNMVLHALVALLLYLCLARLQIPEWAALVTGLLFAVHPLNTEAVSGVVGRAEIMAAFFGLVFFMAHRGRRAPFLCALALLCAMWSKESGITYVGLAFAADELFPRVEKRWPWSAYEIYGLTICVWLFLRAAALGQHTTAWAFVDNPLLSASLTERLCTTAQIHLHYLWLYLFPVGLSSDYSYNQIPLIRDPADLYVAGALLVLLGVFIVGLKFRKKHAALVFALLGYAILFSVTSNVLFPIGSTAERFLYSPSLMWCLGASYAVWLMRQRLGRPVEIGLAVVLVCFAGLTSARNKTWQDDLVFFKTQAQSAPHSAKAHFNYGTALAKHGRDQGAVDEYTQAITIFPLYSEPFYNMGNALDRLGADPDKVIEAYRNTIKCDPGHVEARVNLALQLIKVGRRQEAVALVNEVESMAPDHASLPILRLKLGSAATSQNTGPKTAAIPQDLQEGIRKYASGDSAGAIKILEKAVAAGQVPPSLKTVTLNILSRCYEARGDKETARKYREQAGH